MARTPCPDPQETGEAVLGMPVRPEVLRHLEECPSCRQEALILIRFLPPRSFRLQDDPVHARLIHGCVLLRLHPAPGRGLDAGVP
jgi:hypothetical protein